MILYYGCYTQAQIDIIALFHPSLRLKKIFDILHSVQYA